MAKKNAKPIKKRRKLRLKKSARRTIAALMMVSALIVALIPVKDVIAEVSDDIHTEIENNSLVDPTTTSVATNTNVYYAFPYNSNVELKTDIEGYAREPVYGIETSGMNGVNAVFTLQKDHPEVLNEYIGEDRDSGYYPYMPSQGEINLENAVCYTASSLGDGGVFEDFYYIGDDGNTYHRVETVRVNNETDKYIEVIDTPVTKNDETGAYEASGDPINVGSFCDTTKNITNVADKAFDNTSRINSVKMPSGVTMIGNGVFHNCEGLSSIGFASPAALLTIGCSAFEGCSKLGSFPFSDTDALATIGDLAFSGTGISEFQLPGALTTLGSGAFSGCDSLTDSGIFSGLTGNLNIGSYVFADCDNLDHMVLTNAVNDFLENSKGTFVGCDKLRYVEFPEGFGKTIQAGTFKECPNLEYVHFYGSGSMADSAEYEFVTCDNLPLSGKSETTVPDSFFIWGPEPSGRDSWAYDYAVNNSNLYCYGSSDSLNYVISYGKYIFDADIDTHTINGISGIKDGVPKAEAINDFRIPECEINGNKMSTLGAGFSESLTNNKINPKPTKLTVPSSYSSIESNALKGMDSLKELYVDTYGITVGNNALEDCDVLQKVEFNKASDAAGPIQIGDDCFRNCKELESVAFNTDVKSFGTLPFYCKDGASKLTSVSFNGESGGTSDNPKYECYNGIIYSTADGGASYTIEEVLQVRGGAVGSVEVPDGEDATENDYFSKVNSIKERAFKDCDKVVVVDLTESPNLTVIPDECFNNCDDLAEIDIPGSVINIGTKAVADCKTSLINAYIYPNKEDCIIAYDIFSGDATVKLHGSTPSAARTFYDNRTDSYNVDALIWEELKKPKVTFYDETGENVLYCLEVIEGHTVGDTVRDASEEDIGDWPEGTDPDSMAARKPGSTFLGWLIQGTGGTMFDVNALFTLKIYEATNLQAKYDDKYTVSFYYDDTLLTKVENVESGRTIGNTVGDWPAGTDAETMSKKKPDSVFQGWYTSQGTKLSLTTEITDNVEVEARYNYNTCKLFFIDEYNNKLKYSDSDGVEHDYLLYGVGDLLEKEDIPNDIRYATDPNTGLTAVDPLYWDPAIPLPIEDDQIFTVYYSNDPVVSYTVTYYDANKTEIKKSYPSGYVLDDGTYMTSDITQMVNAEAERLGLPFAGWKGVTFPYTVTKDVTFTAIYGVFPTPTPDPGSSSTSGSSTSGSSTSGSSTSSGSSSSSSSKSSSSSSSSKSSSSSSSASSSNVNSSTTPVVVSGAVSGYTPQGNAGNISSGGSSGGGNTGGGTQRGSGNTNVISTTPGISDVGKMSATVNGSSDSYVLKITETDEANRMAAQALSNEYGSLNDIRYLPIDISLYDSTGQNKISPIPENTSVSVTMPIPDDLAIYGGNAKVAGTSGGVLEKMDARFTMIDSVPCMNFNCTHLSPYVIYVDTANLSDPSMLDSTPKTGDMIHPKWFLVIGLAAGSIFLFLKRDKGERIATA